MPKRIVVTMTMTIELQDEQREHDASSAECALCGWSRAYKSPSAAKRGLAAHLPHCPKRKSAREKSNDIIRGWMNEMISGED